MTAYLRRDAVQWLRERGIVKVPLRIWRTDLDLNTRMSRVAPFLVHKDGIFFPGRKDRAPTPSRAREIVEHIIADWEALQAGQRIESPFQLFDEDLFEYAFWALTTVTLTSGAGGSWTVPLDFDADANTIQCVGPGRDGADGLMNVGGGGGGGAGAFSQSLNLSGFTPGSTVTIQVGTRVNGNETFIRNSADTKVVGALGGQPGSGATGGAGGAAASGTGATRFSGGNGGTRSNSAGGGGGGGAAGPDGAGKNGGGSSGTLRGGGGGGGANGGLSTAGESSSTSTGGAGGNGRGGSGGGAGGVTGGTSSAANGQNGSNGGGGGGACGNHTGSRNSGGNGGNEIVLTDGSRVGGGGGGGGTRTDTESVIAGGGGTAGNFGGGGGGGGHAPTNSGNLGQGRNGVIAISYVPLVSAIAAHRMFLAF